MYSLRKNSPEVLICEGACVVGDVTLGRGVSVWYNAVIRGDKGPITIGAEPHVQDGVVMHNHTPVGAGCTLGHNAIVPGCTLGDNVLIGMGAVVLDGARIANDCLVGAGALVTGKMDAPAGSMILGSPAKVVRPLTAEEIEGIRESRDEYLELARLCREAK